MAATDRVWPGAGGTGRRQATGRRLEGSGPVEGLRRADGLGAYPKTSSPAGGPCWGLGFRIGSQNAVPMTSRPATVANAFHVGRSIVSEMRWTEPSANNTFTPPGWKLAACHGLRW